MLPSITEMPTKNCKAGSIQPRINTAIDTILENPHYHVHIKKLEGELKDMYRYRLGNLGILYEIHEDIKTIRIKAIEARGSAYK